MEGCLSVCCDSLGSHNTGDFTENFSRASHMCLYCLAKRFEMHDNTEDVESFIRRTL